jgi:DNA-binding transcriptional LysR family regulator
LVGAATYDVLPRLARNARERLPEVELSFFEMQTREQVEALALRRIDIGLGCLPRGARNIQTAVIARERFVLAARNGHPLEQISNLRLRDLGDYAVIGYEPSEATPTYELLEHIFITAEFTPRIVQRSRQTHTILSLVEAGVGVAFVPETARRACFENVRFQDVQMQRRPLLDMHCLWRPDNTNPALAAFRSLVLATFSSNSNHS